MLCDICHNAEGIIFVESMTPSGPRKITLCNACALARGINPPIPSNPKLLAGIFKEIDERNAKNNPDEKKLCPVCAKSLAFIKRTGTVGCPECYNVFKEEIKQNMQEHGILGKYTGSMPKRLAGFRNSLTDRADLQKKLDEAVALENYEKAAFYRDCIRCLEKGFVANGEENENQPDFSEEQK